MILAMTTQNSNHPCACGSYAFEVLIHENVGGDKVWQQKTTAAPLRLRAPLRQA